MSKLWFFGGVNVADKNIFQKIAMQDEETRLTLQSQ